MQCNLRKTHFSGTETIIVVITTTFSLPLKPPRSYPLLSEHQHFCFSLISARENFPQLKIDVSALHQNNNRCILLIFVSQISLIHLKYLFLFLSLWANLALHFKCRTKLFCSWWSDCWSVYQESPYAERCECRSTQTCPPCEQLTDHEKNVNFNCFILHPDILHKNSNIGWLHVYLELVFAQVKRNIICH